MISDFSRFGVSIRACSVFVCTTFESNTKRPTVALVVLTVITIFIVPTANKPFNGLYVTGIVGRPPEETKRNVLFRKFISLENRPRFSIFVNVVHLSGRLFAILRHVVFR